MHGQGFRQQRCPELRGAGLLLGPWGRRDAVNLNSLQRIVHGLPTVHTRSISKPLSCPPMWGDPWMGQSPDLGLQHLPSCCPWVGLGELHSCSSVWHRHGNPKKPERDRPSSVPRCSTVLETLWQKSSKDPGPDAQSPTLPCSRRSKDLVAYLLHGQKVLKTWEHES